MLDKTELISDVLQFKAQLGLKMMHFNLKQSSFDEMDKFVQTNQYVLDLCDTNLREKWQLFKTCWRHSQNRLNKEEKEKFLEREKYLLNIAPFDETGGTLDDIWTMYFATHLAKYPEKVKEAGEKTKYLTTKSAAIWSYNSIINEQKIGK